MKVRASFLAATLLAAVSAAARAGEPVENLRDDIDRLLRQGNRAGALDMARSAHEAVPKDLFVRHCYGWALLEAGRAPEALPHLKAAADAFPGDARVHNNLGCALLATGDADGAAAAFRAAVGLDPAFAAPRNNHGVVLEKAGYLEEAERAFRAALARDPAYAQAHNNLGALLFDTGRGAEAMEHFVAAAEADPSYASPRINLGALALARGDNEQAGRLLREAAARPDARVEAHFNLGLWALRTGDLELARTSLEKALAMRPEDPDVLNNLGVAHLLKKEYRKAEGYFTRATGGRAEFAQAWDNLGLSLHFLAVQTGDDPRLLERAEAAFRREVELRPRASFAHYNLGTVLLARGKVDEAASHFRTAIDHAPAHAEALNNLGYCLSMATTERRPDPAAELQCYQQALLADPLYPDPHRSLGIFYASAPGFVDLDRSVEHWKEYARLSPGDVAAQEEAAKQIATLRDQQRKAALKKARAMNP